MPTILIHLIVVLNFIDWTEAAPEPYDELTLNFNIKDQSDYGSDHSSDYTGYQNTSQGLVNYDGYQLYQIKVRNSSEAEKLENLKGENKFDFWRDITVGQTLQVLASPENTAELKFWLDKNGLESVIGIEDIGPLYKVTTKTNDYGFEEMDWNDYHSIETIYRWLGQLEASCSFCTLEYIGKSHERQPMKVMKVCKGGCGKKPAIWIDSAIHAREWISPAVGTWILNELVNWYPQLAEKLDWYFLPIFNPDGYRRSRNQPIYRGHRKSTKSYPGYYGQRCQGYQPSTPGVDLNRNFDFKWGVKPGSGSDPCEDSYHGPRPFSEIESRNVRDAILRYNQNRRIKMYLSLHSYHQQILSVYGSSKKPTPNAEAIQRLAVRGAAAIKAVHGKNYEVGCSPCVNQRPVTGSSKDWAHVVAGIPYSYTLELRDMGQYGFVLPADQIIPNAEEIWAFVALAADQIAQEFGGSRGYYPWMRHK